MRWALQRVTLVRYLHVHLQVHGAAWVEIQGRFAVATRVLRAELVEAVARPRPIRTVGTYIAHSPHRCPLTGEESAC